MTQDSRDESESDTPPDTTRTRAVLITGAGGEIGHGLVHSLQEAGQQNLLAVDLNPLDSSVASRCRETVVADIRDEAAMARLFASYEIDTVYHLAALLSSTAEKRPFDAHDINVNGTITLMRLAREHASQHNSRVRFLFPSTIAVYGLPDLPTKNRAEPVREDQFLQPITMYGCNKLYCEQVGRYLTWRDREASGGLDFRAVRFPGILSAETTPTGGTSDFAPLMIHHAAKGERYASFVDADRTIPFVTMPDAIRAIEQLAAADAKRLSQTVYNVGAFSPSAGDFAEKTRACFPEADIAFEPVAARQNIVDSWPARVDDRAARHDWRYQPQYDFDAAFESYLIPGIQRAISAT
ncbi:MAG: NAD-dependent epimerase/dehydratase family protein [Phycisphaerales bacterium]|nr:MAG: NAD-dependent epimerase/dehydratase family protein [Phycisphaerales bacterium]